MKKTVLHGVKQSECVSPLSLVSHLTSLQIQQQQSLDPTGSQWIVHLFSWFGLGPVALFTHLMKNRCAVALDCVTADVKRIQTKCFILLSYFTVYN